MVKIEITPVTEYFKEEKDTRWMAVEKKLISVFHQDSADYAAINQVLMRNIKKIKSAPGHTVTETERKKRSKPY